MCTDIIYICRLPELHATFLLIRNGQGTVLNPVTFANRYTLHICPSSPIENKSRGLKRWQVYAGHEVQLLLCEIKLVRCLLALVNVYTQSKSYPKAPQSTFFTLFCDTEHYVSNCVGEPYLFLIIYIKKHINT